MTDSIHDETLTRTLTRTQSHQAAANLNQRLLGQDGFPDAFTYLWINQDTFNHATHLVQTHPDQRLSFTDATNLATIQHHDLDALLSFDTDDDGRIDPTTL